MDETLEREFAEYALQEETLLAYHEGMYAVIYKEMVLDIFWSWQDAFRQGWKKFKNVQFLVREINRHKPLEYWFPMYRDERKFIIHQKEAGVTIWTPDFKIQSFGVNPEHAVEEIMDIIREKEWLDS